MSFPWNVSIAGLAYFELFSSRTRYNLLMLLCGLRVCRKVGRGSRTAAQKKRKADKQEKVGARHMHDWSTHYLTVRNASWQNIRLPDESTYLWLHCSAVSSCMGDL